jgi:hypothetical protein
MPDPSNVDAAIIALLAGDATLTALMTDGVYMDVANSGATKFVIVSLSTHEDEYVFEGSAFERSQYIVKAVERSNSGTNVKAAAARIHTLLQDQPLTITGYKHSLTRRAERIRYTEVDEVDNDIRWQHRGGRYDVMVSP